MIQADPAPRSAALPGHPPKRKRNNPRHRMVAVFRYFTGLERLPGEDAGNTTLQRPAHRWREFPLQEEVTSVDAVGFPQYPGQGRDEAEARSNTPGLMHAAQPHGVAR